MAIAGNRSADAAARLPEGTGAPQRRGRTVRPGLVVQRSGEVSATFDESRTYRYVLTRHWGAGPRVVFIMLNPSTAVADAADPTIRRVWRFASDIWSAGRVDVVNVFGLRATDPRTLHDHADPIGPANDAILLDACRGGDAIVAAWGTRAGERGLQVRRLLQAEGIALHVLRLTRDGHPGHPLYLPAGTVPIPWRSGGAGPGG